MFRRSGLLGLSFVAVVWWWWAAPPAELEVSGPVEFGPIPEGLRNVGSAGDILSSTAERIGNELPGYDDVVVFGDGSALASGMDGWIWKIRLETGEAERWVDAPLMPAGLRAAPDDPDALYFCSAVLHGEVYPATERVGLYRVSRSTKEITPIVLEVPRDTGTPESAQVFPETTPARIPGTRPLAFCNDLDISADGQRIYFSEPFAYEGASMGGGAVANAIALGRNGRLWMHDRTTGATRLVARGFFFLDGVLIEENPFGGREASVLVTETTRFRILRFFVSGPDAGRSVVLWRDLPGMPDGLDRDVDGNVWVGLLGLRSSTTDWIHAHPWIKPLLLRLPRSWIPKGRATGLLALDPGAKRARFLGLHDGSFVRDISVAIPVGERVYLASFDPEQRGLVWMPRPVFPPASDGAER